MLLGACTETIFDEHISDLLIDYKIGDIVVLITDGVLEARNSFQNEYSETRLIDLFRKNADKTASVIRDIIIKDVNGFTGDNAQFDDITVVVVKAIPFE